VESYHALGNLAKDDVLAVQPRSNNSGDEELRAVGYKDGQLLRNMVSLRQVQNALLGPALAILL